MTKPISKSKRQLAQLLIEAGVTQFHESAGWVAQDKDGKVFYYSSKPSIGKGCEAWAGGGGCSIACKLSGKSLPNWRRTVLSRDEFDQIVAETAPRSTAVGDDETDLAVKEELEALEFTLSPTLDQLLQDWRNADDYAQRKQTEADEAAVMRDERWRAAQARAGEMGVMVGLCESATTDESGREWSILDHCIVVDSPDDTGWEGRKCVLLDVDYDDDKLPYSVIDSAGDSLWVHSIRRP